VARRFDPGCTREPFASLCEDVPGPDAYPAKDFRLEWGPIFHRGRLDGSARVLVIGQDPGAHEAVVRRILVGEAGQRVQGFLAKLGIESSYVMINTFLFSVTSQQACKRHKDNVPIVEYRNRWLDALIVGKRIEAVVAFGSLADDAFRKWQATPAGQAVQLAYEHLIHPTYPGKAASHDPVLAARALKRLLASWNRALPKLATAIEHPDVRRPLAPYGELFEPSDLAPIPERDLPVGLPAWMRSLDEWATRQPNPAIPGDPKRATLVITVPKAERPWL
jgi:uracil-DNA glycosylase